MHRVAISSTGIYIPPEVISNEELVTAFNQFAELENTRRAAEIAAGTCQPVPLSSVEFIEKASGIQRRYVMEKSACWTRSACVHACRREPTPKSR